MDTEESCIALSGVLETETTLFSAGKFRRKNRLLRAMTIKRLHAACPEYIVRFETSKRWSIPRKRLTIATPSSSQRCYNFGI